MSQNISDIDELIRTGQLDITARMENDTDRESREAEPGAYALTYDEAMTVTQTHNIIVNTMIKNDFTTLDEKTRTRIFSFNPDSTAKILEEFKKRDLDPDQLYALADRVLSGNWYTLLISSVYSPGKGKGPGYFLRANVNGKIDEGILKIEEYPSIYDIAGGRSPTKDRDALRLPKDTGFLFSLEEETLNTLRQICSPQLFIEEKIGYLAPLDMMPNSAIFPFTSRFINNPHIRERNAATTSEKIEILKGAGENEFIIRQTTRNSINTITVADIFLFADKTTTGEGKSRRSKNSGVSKVWEFALQKLMQQSSAHITPATIIIDLDEMVSIGMFTNTDNAYRAIETMIQKMGLLHLAQETLNTGKKIKHGGFLFYDSRRSGSRVEIYVNTLFGFEFFHNQYAYFPTAWVYKLGSDAFSLTRYIFSQMRQNANRVNSNGKFKIKLTTIQSQLGIKSIEEVRENHNRRYGDFIKKPILQAIDEVNEAAKKDKEIDGKFKISLKTADTTSIEKWLDGYIEITATGEYTSHLTTIAENQRLFDTTYKEEKVRQAAKRRARSSKRKTENATKN